MLHVLSQHEAAGLWRIQVGHRTKYLSNRGFAVGLFFGFRSLLVPSPHSGSGLVVGSARSMMPLARIGAFRPMGRSSSAAHKAVAADLHFAEFQGPACPCRPF